MPPVTEFHYACHTYGAGTAWYVLLLLFSLFALYRVFQLILSFPTPSPWTGMSNHVDIYDDGSCGYWDGYPFPRKGHQDGALCISCPPVSRGHTSTPPATSRTTTWRPCAWSLARRRATASSTRRRWRRTPSRSPRAWGGCRAESCTCSPARRRGRGEARPSFRPQIS